MKILHMVTWILLIIGGLNWLLTGLIAGWDLGMYVGSMVATIIYILVGLSAIYEVIVHKKNCKMCGGMSSSSSPMGGMNR